MNAGLFDYILVAALVLLTWQMFRMKDLFVGIVLYMVFGLLMALAWVQLNAPDIALVEAAIGSGLIGAFFLGVLGRLEGKSRDLREHPPALMIGRKAGRLLVGGGCLVVGGIVFNAILSLPDESSGLSHKVATLMSASGVDNPVTAVILNFRAYDTLLEIGVLFLAALTVAALAGFNVMKASPKVKAENLLIAFVHLLVPFMILVAGYLLYAGSDLPGGAFQAGAIFAGAGVLFLLAGRPVNFAITQLWLKVSLAAGFFIFFAAGLAVMDGQRRFLQYPPGSAKLIILGVEVMATLSIAVIFVYLFAVCAGFLFESPETKNRWGEGETS